MKIYNSMIVSADVWYNQAPVGIVPICSLSKAKKHRRAAGSQLVKSKNIPKLSACLREASDSLYTGLNFP